MRDLSYFDNIILNLEIMSEECAEIQQIKSKIIRFGIDDYHPKNEIPNREKLEQEIGHFLAMIDILIDNGLITTEGIENGKIHKFDKLPKWYKKPILQGV